MERAVEKYGQYDAHCYCYGEDYADYLDVLHMLLCVLFGFGMPLARHPVRFKAI